MTPAEQDGLTAQVKESNHRALARYTARKLANKPDDWERMPRALRWLAGRRIGPLSLLFTFGGYSTCAECHTSWYFVDPHSVMTSMSGGYFTHCEACWRDLYGDTSEQEAKRWKEIVEREGPTYARVTKARGEP